MNWIFKNEGCHIDIKLLKKVISLPYNSRPVTQVTRRVGQSACAKQPTAHTNTHTPHAHAHEQRQDRDNSPAVETLTQLRRYG